MRPGATPPPVLMLLMLVVCFLCDLSRVESAEEKEGEEETRSRERLLLGSLGLSGRPRPHRPRRHVPSALWRMFRRSEGVRSQEGDPCTVSEYGVRGNIIRYVQDQGTGVSGGGWWESSD